MGCPEVLSGVGSPRTPALGVGFEAEGSRDGGVEAGHAAEESDVGGGEGVGLPHGAEGDVLGSPFADAGDRSEASNRGVDGGVLVKEGGVRGYGFRERFECALARGRHA